MKDLKLNRREVNRQNRIDMTNTITRLLIGAVLAYIMLWMVQ